MLNPLSIHCSPQHRENIFIFTYTHTSTSALPFSFTYGETEV